MNYIMLPENYQPRSRPGHRAKKVSETFSPMSRAGRRVQGEAKATATMAGNAKKEDGAKEFTKFVKTLNKKVAGQRRAAPRARNVVEVDVPRPTKTSERLERLERLTAWLARSSEAARADSRLSSKRESAKSVTEPIWRRTVRRVKVKIAMSSTVNVPRPYNPVNQNHVVVDTNATVQHQTLVDPTDAILINEGTLYHQLPSADTIQNHLPFNQHPVIAPGLSQNVMAHQNVLVPGPEIHNHDYLELERTAVACAYMGMDQDEPMDLSLDFPSVVANDDYRDLERTAIACAYAAMDELMDTTLDDTLGPMAYVMHQNVPPVIGFVGNTEERQFDHAGTFQQLVYETLRPPGHQDFIDQDYRLRPPAYAHIDNQVLPQPHQERFVNENLSPHHYHQVAQYPQDEDYLGFLPEFGHNAPIHPVVQRVFYEQDIPRMNPDHQQAEIYHHYIDHDVHFHPGVQQERFDQGPVQQYLNGLVPDVEGNWNGDGGYQHAGAEGQHDNPGFFVDEFGGNVVEQEEPNRHTDEAYIPYWIEDLFGANDKEDDYDGDDDDNEPEEQEVRTPDYFLIPSVINHP